MSKARYVKIEKLEISRNRLLEFKLSYSKNVRKYFSGSSFYVEYDKEVHNVSRSILHIPAVANIITLAWAIGADIYVKELDKTYLESLNKVKSVFKRFYPKLPFSTRINVEEIVSNRFFNEGYGLLFSGGVDSMTSYIRHKDKKPNLIMVWGVDIPVRARLHWMQVRGIYKEFAAQENVKINFIKTNIREFLNEFLLDTEFGRYAIDLSWWGGFHHGIALLGLCAPLTMERIGTILIASGASPHSARRYAWGSSPLIDNKISVADIKVVHDGYELSREEKIGKVLKGYIRNERRYPALKVCWSQYHDFNCSKCEKCSRTITGLVLQNIDPNKCGFRIDSNFFAFLRENLIKGGFTSNEQNIQIWKRLQRSIPKELTNDLYNSKEFFAWFRDFDISGNAKRIEIRARALLTRLRALCLLGVYNRLPKIVQNTIRSAHYNALAQGFHLYDIGYWIARASKMVGA